MASSHSASSSWMRRSVWRWGFVRNPHLLALKFSTKESLELDPIAINDKQIDIVSHAKILGVNVSRDLKWNHHIAEIVKKAGKRLFCLSRVIPFSGVSVCLSLSFIIIIIIIIIIVTIINNIWTRLSNI